MSTDPSLHAVDLTVVESNLAIKWTSSNSNLNNISGTTESDSEWINSLVAFVNQVTASSTTSSSNTTSVNATGASENVDTKPTTKVKSKRINVADTATEDASDFFKNLLAGGKK